MHPVVPTVVQELLQGWRRPLPPGHACGCHGYGEVLGLLVRCSRVVFFNFVYGCIFGGWLRQSPTFSAVQFERAAALSPWDSHINAALRACKDTLRLVPMEVRGRPGVRVCRVL